MDMVAYQAETSRIPEVLLESTSKYSSVFQVYTSAANQYCIFGLQTVYSTNPFGSDHVPYLERGMPALLVIDNDWDIYPYYHRTTDTSNRLDLKIAMDILRMNVASLAMFVNSTTVISSSVRLISQSWLCHIIFVFLLLLI